MKLLLIILFLLTLSAQAQNTFTNPVYKGQDPHVTLYKGWYYQPVSTGGKITVYRSQTLTQRGSGKTAWTQPEGYTDVWAPELHRIDNHWYIYTCYKIAGPHPHQLIVLRSNNDEADGEYTLMKELTGREFPHAIDPTVMHIRNQTYLLWAGVKRSDPWKPSIWIAPLIKPDSLDLSRMRCISRPVYAWELDQGTQLHAPDCNEGPEVLQHDGQTFIIYSAARTANASYCLGMLTLEGRDPLDSAAWRKSTQPVFKTTGNQWGPGHCSFTTSPDGQQHWIVYHTLNKLDSWDRSVNIQPFDWNADGSPHFGDPVQRGIALPKPSGDQ